MRISIILNNTRKTFPVECNQEDFTELCLYLETKYQIISICDEHGHRFFWDENKWDYEIGYYKFVQGDNDA